MSFFRFGAALAFLLALALTTADVASARIGSGSSFGSRGTRTFTPPPTTNPAASAPTAPAASRFGGLRGLLLGGLIAAALGGIFGFGVLAHIVGFVLQLLLIAGLVWLVMAYLRSRRTGAPLFARGAAAGPPIDLAYPNGATRPNGSARAATPSQALNISQQDLDTFERLLGEVQTAFSREDTQRLGRMA